MQNHIVDEKTGIPYTLVGDYYLPWGVLPDDEPEQRPIAAYGGIDICGIYISIAVHFTMSLCIRIDLLRIN